MNGGIITAPQPEAVEAGADVLRDGGNAVDAAVACALVQTAVDPIMCGLAGFGSMHLYMPEQGVHGFIDFHGRAPAAARPDMWADIVLGEAEDGFGFLLKGAVNEIGYQSIMTPHDHPRARHRAGAARHARAWRSDRACHRITPRKVFWSARMSAASGTRCRRAAACRTSSS